MTYLYVSHGKDASPKLGYDAEANNVIDAAGYLC
jgi:hypothetical protein